MSGKMMKALGQKFELSRGDAHNLRAMEGLRGFAVFLVFLVHYVTLVKPWLATSGSVFEFADALHTMGNVGVDLFFVLSGYLIYGTLIARPQRFGRFMARRIQRIYPAFIAVFAVYVALSFVMPSQSKLPSNASDAAVYLVENFLLLPGIFPIEPMISVAWSLSYEMFYYLAMPLLVAMLGLRARSSAWRAAFFFCAAVIASVYCAYYGGLIRLAMFVSGILLCEAMRNPRIPVPNGLVGLSALILGLLGTLLPLTGNGAVVLKTGILFVAFFLLCLCCFRAPSAWLPRAFSWTPLRRLGNMSYSYYLTHGLALKAGFLIFAILVPAHASRDWGLFCVLLPATFMLTLVPAAMLFLLVERPFSLAAPRVAAKSAADEQARVPSDSAVS
jgi:peptidoglycan/LPS O-acetylase OafA/YrhL